MILFLNIVALNARCQSAGEGTVSTIETKADQIEKNGEKIADINRKRMQSYVDENDKLISLKAQLEDLKLKKIAIQAEVDKRLAAKLDEIDNSEAWKNRRKSAQNGWQENSPGTCSAGGPPPICVADHWHRVSIAAAMAEYEAYKKQVLDEIRSQADKSNGDIARKQAEIRKFESEENEFTRKRADWDKQMNELRADNSDLLDEIVQLSKKYREIVVAEAKGIAAGLVSELMRMVAEKHFVEDRIDILMVKIGDLDKQEIKATADLREKIRKQNDAEIQKQNDKITTDNTSLISLDDYYKQQITPLNTKLDNLNSRLTEIKRKLFRPGDLATGELAKYTTEKKETEDKIQSAQEEINGVENKYKTDNQKLKDDIKVCRDKIWDLTTGLSRLQDEAVSALKNAFAEKRKILLDAAVARKAYLQNLGDLLIQKKESARQKFMDYAKPVEQERIRLMAACRKAGASCFGTDTYGAIILIWNNASGCVGEMESNKSIGIHYGCETESPIYQQHYNSFMSGLSDSDLEALQRRTSKAKYDLIIRKVLD